MASATNGQASTPAAKEAAQAQGVVKASRRANAQGALKAQRRREHTLAQGCAWIDISDDDGVVVGRIGVTAHEGRDGKATEYVTFEPKGTGRPAGIPTYALFPLIDAGALD